MDKIRNLIVISILLIFTCGAVFLFVDGFYAPTPKPCRPISYPAGKTINARPTRVSDYTTTDSIEAVTGFYNKLLDAEVGWDIWSEGVWRLQQFDEKTFVYECYAQQKYLFIAPPEQGCIFVQEIDGKTVIRTVLFQRIDYFPCRNSPQEYEL